MACVPPKSGEQKSTLNVQPLPQALIDAGVYTRPDDGMALDEGRMQMVARQMASEPEISKTAIAKRLGMARNTVKRYFDRIERAVAAGRLGLEPYAEEVVEDEGGGIAEYDPTASLEMTLRLVQGQKSKLLRKQAGGKAVSVQQILQLVDAEKKLLSIPQRAEDVPKDFYDQLFGRVPVPDQVCPHCGGVVPGGEAFDSEARVARDFEELGAAGDLAGEEAADEQKEAVGNA